MKIEDEIQQQTFKSEYQKAHVNIIYTANWLQSTLGSMFKPFGITMPQFNILRILRGQYPKPATVNLLIERMMDKTSNASRIVDKLELKGLVSRKQCPNDRRSVDILITGEGLELLKKTDKVMGEFRVGFEHLTVEEAAELNRLLDKVRD